jgi:hypothetical protein
VRALQITNIPPAFNQPSSKIPRQFPLGELETAEHPPSHGYGVTGSAFVPQSRDHGVTGGK